MKKLFLLLCGAILSLPTLAQDFAYEYEGFTIEYKITDKETRTVKVYNPGDEYYDYSDGSTKDLPTSISIPAQVVNEGVTYTVDEINSEAFFGFRGLSYVRIPATVTKFGADAFDCPDLVGVDFPSVECLCSASFRKDRYSPRSYECNPLYFAHNLYINGEKVTNLVIPESVTVINDYAFAGGSFSSVTIGPNVTSIGVRAFYECDWLKSVTIPASVKEIDQGAFTNCSSLEKADFASIEAMNGIVYIESSSLSSNPLYLAHNLYINGESVKDLVIPDTITEINETTFCGGHFNSIKFPRNLESIGSNSFTGCAVRNDVSIPSSVVSIGKSAFQNSDLKSIILEDGLTEIYLGDKWYPSDLEGLYIGRPHKPDFAKPFTNLKWLSIGNLITKIEDSEFESLLTLETVAFGSGLTEIGNNAFAECWSLTKVVFPPALKVVGNSAFERCCLKEIMMGPNVALIGHSAFALCPVESVAITAQQTPAVGDNTFTEFNWTLMVQGEKAKDTYSSSSNFWSSVKCELLTEATYVKNDCPFNVLCGKPGESFALAASVRGDDASLKEVFWKSTDPSVAIVNLNGVVTLQPGIAEEGAECQIIAESLYTDVPGAIYKVKYGDSSEVETIPAYDSGNPAIDYSAPYEVYGLDGRPAGKSVEGLAKGIYVIRQGNNAYKIIAK